MDPITFGIAQGAAGAGSDPLYVDDVFSTYLYEGNGTSQTITNGIDLSGEGGLVWIKQRLASASEHVLTDTERGQYYLSSDNDLGNQLGTNMVTGFTSNGFNIGSASNVNRSVVGENEFASWTFRKAPGFFDVVTYTGNGVEGRDIAHSLGSVPGAMIVKNLDTSDVWRVYHRELTADETLRLSSTAAKSSTTGPNTFWNGTRPTASVFTVGQQGGVNASGNNYVAYLFAHDDQSFGTNSDEAIIKCGSYTGTGSSGNAINLGFEPQWVILKPTDTTTVNDWQMYDNMRGIYGSQSPTANSAVLYPNLSNAESNDFQFSISSTGFTPIDSHNNSSGIGYIYIAIRRPHKPPSAGTDVFQSLTFTGTAATEEKKNTNFPVDLMHTHRTSGGTPYFMSRLQGALRYMNTASDAVEGSGFGVIEFGSDYVTLDNSGPGANSGEDYINSYFRRAPGFMDVVAWAGDGTNNRAISHNLTVTPELLITKRRTFTDSWWTQYTGIFGTDTALKLNQNTALSTGVSAFNGTSAATSSVFYVGSDSSINGIGDNYIAYLFATLPGISKVGFYTGTGNSDINVDCGFTAGARFVLIKRTDQAGDWYVWDSTRGIVSGNDPYLLMNNSNAEATIYDYIDPLNTGFTVTSSGPAALNGFGGNYLFLAIA